MRQINLTNTQQHYSTCQNKVLMGSATHQFNKYTEKLQSVAHKSMYLETDHPGLLCKPLEEKCIHFFLQATRGGARTKRILDFPATGRIFGRRADVAHPRPGSFGPHGHRIDLCESAVLNHFAIKAFGTLRNN